MDNVNTLIEVARLTSPDGLLPGDAFTFDAFFAGGKILLGTLVERYNNLSWTVRWDDGSQSVVDNFYIRRLK